MPGLSEGSASRGNAVEDLDARSEDQFQEKQAVVPGSACLALGTRKTWERWDIGLAGVVLVAGSSMALGPRIILACVTILLGLSVVLGGVVLLRILSVRLRFYTSECQTSRLTTQQSALALPIRRL